VTGRAAESGEIGHQAGSVEETVSTSIPAAAHLRNTSASTRNQTWEDQLAKDMRKHERSAKNLFADLESTHGTDNVDFVAVKLDAVIKHREKKAAEKDAVHWRESKLGISDYVNRVFGIGPPLGPLESSRLIHPYSPFAQSIAVASSVFLLYTALVTPVVLCFHWNAEACWINPFLRFDIALDSFFLIEIIYTCFAGAYIDGVYVDDMKAVVTNYFRSGAMFFDMFTSIPVSYLELAAEINCLEGSQDEGGSSELRMLRIVKPLRLFKLLRLIRAMKFVNVFEKLQSVLQVPLVIFQLTKLLILTFYMVHICACIYWFVKEGSNTEGEMSFFFSDQNLEDVTASKYVLSAYFISSVFTTVGFGDVAATNEAEQVFCMLIMYMGTFVFGTLLSEVESAVEAARHYVRAKGRVKQQMQEYLRSNGVNRLLIDKILSWIDFNFAAQQGHLLYAECVAQIPKSFRLELLEKLHDGKLRAHPVFAKLRGDKADMFLAELWGCMHVACFAEGDIVASNYLLSSHMVNTPDRSYLIHKGSVDFLVQGTKVVELQAGDYIGELCCLGDGAWCCDLELPLSFLAQSNVTCLGLTKHDLDEVLACYPQLQQEVVQHTERVRRSRMHSVDVGEMDVMTISEQPASALAEAKESTWLLPRRASEGSVGHSAHPAMVDVVSHCAGMGVGIGGFSTGAHGHGMGGAGQHVKRSGAARLWGTGEMHCAR